MELVRRNTGYGLRALVHMATGSADDSFTAEDLAEAAETTVEFMHKILQDLRHAGIVASKRGPHGGFRLVTGPGQVSLLAVVEALQGPLTVNRCVMGLDICHRAETCPLRPTWVKVQRDMEQALSDTTLADIVGVHEVSRAKS